MHVSNVLTMRVPRRVHTATRFMHQCRVARRQMACTLSHAAVGRAHLHTPSHAIRYCQCLSDDFKCRHTSLHATACGSTPLDGATCRRGIAMFRR
eukprot:6192299-Pleurochrysis_carterae.AAC.1